MIRHCYRRKLGQRVDYEPVNNEKPHEMVIYILINVSAFVRAATHSLDKSVRHYNMDRLAYLQISIIPMDYFECFFFFF